MSAHLNVTDKSSPCVIQNISAGGVFIETREALPVGMPVAVNLARPGWSRVLKVTGRVVWALAEKTAQKKGTVPGMRIKFDPLSKETASRLGELLSELGAPDSPAPPTRKDPGVITEPSSVKAIQERLEKVQSGPKYPVVKDPAMSAPNAPRKLKLEKRPDDATMPARVGDLAAVFGKPSDEAPRLIVQVQGLLMQLGELQQQLETRERELQTLKVELSAKDAALEKSDRERRAAELAIQRLSMQLASRR